MSLDLAQIALPVQKLAQELKTAGAQAQERLETALALARSRSLEWPDLGRKIQASRTTWLVAGLVEGLAQAYPPPSCPPAFTVLATDGSHIAAERHHPAHCYLINLGHVRLHYGPEPQACLLNQPHLHWAREDMTIPDPAGGQGVPIEGPILGMKRGVEEATSLARMAQESPDTHPTLALLDGSLIMWGLAGQDYPPFVRQALLDKGLLPALDRLKAVAEHRPLALASYISLPRSTDVVNALRVALCPHEVADCDRYCHGPQAPRECQPVAGILDRELFARLLRPGERSAVFLSQSSVVKNYYGEHHVGFFYLHVGEIARLEVPLWVTKDKARLELAQALVFDQCQRAQGYPVALGEAHEQAVVTAADRENFWHLVEQALGERDLPVITSAKSFSKQTRWV